MHAWTPYGQRKNPRSGLALARVPTASHSGRIRQDPTYPPRRRDSGCLDPLLPLRQSSTSKNMRGIRFKPIWPELTGAKGPARCRGHLPSCRGRQEYFISQNLRDISSRRLSRTSMRKRDAHRVEHGFCGFTLEFQSQPLGERSVFAPPPTASMD